MPRTLRNDIIKEICKEYGVEYTQSEDIKNLLTIHLKKDFIFYGRRSPLNTVAAQAVTKSKVATYSLLKDSNIFIPKSTIISRKKVSTTEINKKINQLNCSFPIVVKPSNTDNSLHVYICNTVEEIHEKILLIFNDTANVVTMVLLQEFVHIKKEVRVIIFNKNMLSEECGEFTILSAYEKLLLKQRHITGPSINETIKSSMVTNPDLLSDFLATSQELIRKIPGLNFAGIDFAIDENNKIWFIEVNGNPGFKHLLKFHGTSALKEIYRKIIYSLR